MYSFAQNDSVAVIDEPLYGHYLRVTGADHPGSADVIAAMNCDGNAVMRELLRRQAERQIINSALRDLKKHVEQSD